MFHGKWHTVVAIQFSNFISRGLILLGVVSTHSIDVACKGRIVGTNKDFSLGSNQLIQHAIIVGVDPLNEGGIAIQKVDFVVLGKDLEE